MACSAFDCCVFTCVVLWVCRGQFCDVFVEAGCLLDLLWGLSLIYLFDVVKVCCL